MVMANTERISRALDLLRDGLRPKCEETWQGFYGDDWLNIVNQQMHHPERSPSTDDVAFLFKCIKATWREVFGHGFSNSTRSLVFELADVRNTWAHQGSFSTDDTVRALDSMERVLEAFGNVEERGKLKTLRRDLMRQMFDEESRSERRRTAAKPTEGQPQAGLTPWRDVITPHADVASGRFDQAEFAADLFEVASGTADEEYQDPKAFFARTYLTAGLTDMLTGAARRLSGGGGDPVIELQTNFGGGKTHSMIALYHLASGVEANELPGVGDALASESLELPADIKRAVIVGQMTSVSAPKVAEKDVTLHTLWGHLAYQLGGKDAYELVRTDDEAGTNPGGALKTLFEQRGPAVILIDEWVAYARQLRDGSERSIAGDFDTQFTFAQALTEAAAAVPNVVLLISIPASDIEVGGERGRAALEKLKNVVTRKAAQWQPASPDESFEIVRRRLFDPVTPENAKVRDGVIRAFSEMYRTEGRDFPSGVSEADYRRRMELSYPIHPELFDRLFGDWSTLDKFQRTRGVLRFMALAISQLWQRGDQSLLIMPGNLPMDSGALVSEMKKYLEEGWDPVIKSDVDGENALPIRIDKDNKHFGRLSATRRAARTVYMGSAARPDGSRGVDIKHVVLGCVQPGEPAGQFADALKRLSGQATHLYVDGAQYWYSLQPNVTRMAADRAASNYTDDDADLEVQRRLLEISQADRAAFTGIHVFPDGPGDVPDEDDGVRLVILSPTSKHIPNEDDSPAAVNASALLAQRSAGPRLHRNLLVFLAASGPRLEELRSAARSYLAWQSINDETEALNLTPHQQRQASSKLTETNETVNSRIDETFVHVITPKTAPGTADIDWQTTKPSGSGALPRRVANKLQSEEKLISAYGGVRVRMDLDRVPLWSESGDITVGDLWSAYCNHPYMARLASFDVLAEAISNGTSSMNWSAETFAYADAKDDGTWFGVTHGSHVLSPTRSGLLIRPDVVPEPLPQAEDGDAGAGDEQTPESLDEKRDRIRSEGEGDAAQSRRFYARFDLDPVRGIRQLEEVMTNVANHLGEGVKLTLEVEAESAEGFDDRTRRVATENAQQLGALAAEFE